MQKLFLNAFILITLFCLASCKKEGADAASGTGTGGSLARFTVAGNYLYLADYYSIETYDISSPDHPVLKSSVPVGFGVETIYPYKDKLFIGSVDGMFIYSLNNPAVPEKLGSARHVRSCDPVVANDHTAFVTLRGGSPCGPAEDGLYIYNIDNITAPEQKSLLRVSNPYGLGLKDSVVFVCRGNAGLTAVNVKDIAKPKIMYTVNDGDYRDVIVYDDVLICYVTTGLILYDITNLNDLQKVGTMNY